MELNQFRDVDLVIDKANDNFIQRQFVSQGDYRGRTLTVQVTDNGLIGQVPGLMLNLRWQNQASGLADLSAFECIDAENSIFRIEYPEHMMTPGKVVANIQVVQNGKVTHLKSFELTVQKLAGEMVGIVDKAEYGALVAVLADANQFRTDIDTLESVKASKEEVVKIEDMISKMPSATPKETFTNIAALQLKYPNGSTSAMLVLESDGKTGYVYLWNGSEWKKGALYQSQGIGDGTVSIPKFDENLQSVFFGDKSIFVWRIGGIGNGVANSTAIRMRTELVELKEGDAFGYSDGIHSFFLAQYDMDGNFIKNISEYVTSIEIPKTTKYGLVVKRADDGNFLESEVYQNLAKENLKYAGAVLNGEAIANKSIPKDKLGEELVVEIQAGEIDSNRVNNMSATTNVYDPESPDYLDDGLFEENGVWITNTNYRSFKIPASYHEIFNIANSNLTVVGFKVDGSVSENLSNKPRFVINNIETEYFYIPIRKDLIESFEISRGPFSPTKSLAVGKSQTVVEGLEAGFDIWEGKEWRALGTSITATQKGKYAEYVAKRLNLNLNNLGVGGGGLTSFADAGNTTMQALESMTDFKGLLTVEVGPNDWFKCPLGELGDTDETTFFGCLDKASKLMSKKTTARACYITSPATAFDDYASSIRRSVYMRSMDGHYYRDYLDAVKAVAAMYSIPVFDAAGESGLGGYHQNKQTLTDHIHHDILAGEIMGEYIVTKLLSEIRPLPQKLEIASDV